MAARPGSCAPGLRPSVSTIVIEERGRWSGTGVVLGDAAAATQRVGGRRGDEKDVWAFLLFAEQLRPSLAVGRLTRTVYLPQKPNESPNDQVDAEDLGRFLYDEVKERTQSVLPLNQVTFQGQHGKES